VRKGGKRVRGRRVGQLQTGLDGRAGSDSAERVLLSLSLSRALDTEEARREGRWRCTRNPLCRGAGSCASAAGPGATDLQHSFSPVPLLNCSRRSGRSALPHTLASTPERLRLLHTGTQRRQHSHRLAAARGSRGKRGTPERPPWCRRQQKPRISTASSGKLRGAGVSTGPADPRHTSSTALGGAHNQTKGRVEGL
jgi:hypothetical protein